MGQYGPASILVDRVIARAGSLSIDEAFDIYRAHGARVLLKGAAAERHALLRARRAAGSARLSPEYELARRAAVTAWRRALPETQGPWLMVGSAIANAAGALVVENLLDEQEFQLLFGPWRQALGTLTPVGPGTSRMERIRAIDRRMTDGPLPSGVHRVGS